MYGLDPVPCSAPFSFCMLDDSGEVEAGERKQDRHGGGAKSAADICAYSLGEQHHRDSPSNSQHHQKLTLEPGAFN